MKTRAIAAWLAAWVLGGAWLFGTSAWSVAPDGGLGGAWALPVALALLAFARVEPLPRAGVAAAIAGVVAAASAWVWPWPYAAVGPLLGVGLIGLLARSNAARVAATWFVLLGAGMASCALVVAANARFGAFVHELELLTPLYHGLFALLGFSSAQVDGRAFVTDVEHVYAFAPTVEGLGVYPLLLLYAAALPLLAHRGALSWRYAARLAWVGALYLVVRYATMFAWLVSSGDSSLLWRPGVVLASMLPLALLVGRAERAPAARSAPAQPRGFSLRPSAFACGALAVAFAWVAWVAPDPGVVKAGRVMIDEHHSDWEWTDVPIDTKSFGQKTTYNYASLAHLVGLHYDLAINREPLTSERLAQVDVLMVKTPTEAYASEEIAAIRGFVERGGGLFLVGDHTNVFGTSHYLNQIAAGFDLEFVFDATYDNQHGGLSLYRAPRVGRHPAVAHLPPFLFATSCSLNGGLGSQAVQVGYALRTLPADYSQPSFFAEKNAHRHFPFGSFPQALATTAGAGRVLAFSDSTVWSNFFVFLPGKPELLLGMLDWLNRRNSLAGLDAWFAAAAVAALLCGWWASRGRSPIERAVLDLALPATATLALWTPALDAFVRDRYRPTEVRRAHPEVFFLKQDSDYHLPITALVDESRPTLLTFFNWAQRVRLIPRVTDHWDEALARGEALVLARTRTAPTPQELERLGDYLRAGGRVLVVADALAREATSTVLALGGLRWEPLTPAAAPKAGEVAAEQLASPPPRATASGLELRDSAERWSSAELAIEGGTAWLARADGRALIAQARFENGGRLIACGAAALFNDDVLGHGNSEPSDEQRELYELEFDLWRELLPEHAQSRAATPIEAGAGGSR